MSFGYSVGDFLRIVELAWDTYQRCKESTSSYQDIGRDVYSAHTVLKAIHNFWVNEGEQRETLSVNEQEELKVLAESCREALEDLEEIHKAHKDLGDRTGGFRNRLKFAYKDFVQNFGAVRERLQQSIGALAILNATLTAGAHSRALNKNTKYLDTQAQILKYFILRYQEFQDGKREAEPAFSQSARLLSSINTSNSDGQRAALIDIENELRAEDVEVEDIDEHKSFIQDWISIVVLDDDDDDDDEQENQTSTFAGHNRRSSSSNDTTTTSGHRSRKPRLLQSSDQANENQDTAPSQSPSRWSISTHRSKDSHWDDPDPVWTPNKLLLKVFSSMYAYSEGEEPYFLPIRRVFHHLDHTNRAWLPQSMVKTCCKESLANTKWQLNDASLDKIFEVAGRTGSGSGYQVDIEAFTQVIMSIRQLILDNTEEKARKTGLERATMLLAEWFNSSSFHPLLPTYWKRDVMTYDERYLRAVLREGKSKPDNKPPPPHFVNSLLRQDKFSPPLDRNLTNALYLAEQYSNITLSKALTDWRSALKLKPKEELLEYTQALDIVLDATMKFYVLRGDTNQHQLHPLDRLKDVLELVPYSHSQHDLSGVLQQLRNLRTVFWDALLPIIAFTADLCDGSSLPTDPVDIRTWRKLRFRDRADKIQDGVKCLEDVQQTLHVLHDTTERLPVIGKIEEFVMECNFETEALICNQEAEVYGRSFTFEHLKVTQLPVKHAIMKPSLYSKVTLSRTRRLGFPPKEVEVGTSKSEKWSSNTCVIPGLGVNDYKPRFEGFLFKDIIRFTIMVQKGLSKSEEMGYVEFDIKNSTIDNRLRSSEVTICQSVTLAPKYVQEFAKLDVQAELKMKTTLARDPSHIGSTQNIVDQNIPRAWKAKSTSDGRIYFQHYTSSIPTLALWELPGPAVPDGMIVPLPSDWTVKVIDGIPLYYNADDGRTQATPPDEDFRRERPLHEFNYLQKRDMTDSHLFYDSEFASTIGWPVHKRSLARRTTPRKKPTST